MFSNKSYFHILFVVRFTPISLLFLYSPICTLQWVPGPFHSHTFISKHTFDFFPSLPDDTKYFICPFWHFSCSVTIRTHMTKPFVTGKRSLSWLPGFYSSVLFWCSSAVEGSGHFLRHRVAFFNIFFILHLHIFDIQFSFLQGAFSCLSNTSDYRQFVNDFICLWLEVL